MKLLYVSARLPYGPTPRSPRNEAYFVPEIAALERRGHAVWLAPVHPRGRIVPEESAPVLGRALCTGLLSLPVLGAAILEALTRPLRTARSLGIVLRSGGMRALQSNLLAFPKALWLAREARRLRIQHVHAHWANYVATVAMIAARQNDLPWSFCGHRNDLLEGNLLDVKLGSACFVRFISQVSRGLAIPNLDSTSAVRSLVLHMGVDITSETSTNGSGSPSLSPVILCAANLVPVKGHDHLLRAMATLTAMGQECQLWLAGDGPLRPTLERTIVELGLVDRVRFLGQIPRHEILEAYSARKVDLVVLASVDLGGGEHEGIPVSLIEAMVHGIPVIGTNTGGIPELLADGAGVLVKGGDSGAMAQAIQDLLADPTRRIRQGELGRRRIEEEFDIEVIAQVLEEQFESCHLMSAVAVHDAREKL